jgi:hypothetical protein
MEFRLARQFVKRRCDLDDLGDAGPPHPGAHELDCGTKLLSQPPQTTDLGCGLSPGYDTPSKAPQQFALVRATVRGTRFVYLTAPVMGGTGELELAVRLAACDNDAAQAQWLARVFRL